MSRHSKQKLKARDKVTQKMSRDGLIERNESTGSDIKIGKRDVQLDLRGENPVDDSFSAVRKSSAGTSARKRNKAQYRQAEQYKQGDNTQASGAKAQSPLTATDTVRQSVAPIVQQSDSTEIEESPRDEIRRPVETKPADPRRAPQRVPSVNSKPPPKGEDYTPSRQVPADVPIDTAITAPQEPESRLRHDDRLQFEHKAGQTPPRKRKRHPQQTKAEYAVRPLDEAVSPDVSRPGEPTSNRAYERPDVPNSEIDPGEVAQSRPDGAEIKWDKSIKPDKKQRPPTEQTESVELPPQSDSGSESSLQSEKANTPLHTEKPDTPLKTDKPGKLQFSADEAVPTALSRGEVKQQKRYGKAQVKADKSVKKLETAKSKLPAKKKIRSKTIVDEKSGKPKRKLYFENEVKSQSQHLKGALPTRPVKAAGNSALAFGHRKMYQVERDNVATEAAHKGEISAEGGVRMALRHHKLAPYRKVAKLERTAQKKSVNLAYQKALAENPKLKSSVLSRFAQKQKIKRDYAKAAREAKKTAERAKKAGTAVEKTGKAVIGVVKRHPVTTGVVVLLLLLLFCLMSLIGVFGGAGSGGFGGILSASYLAEDADIDNAELLYTEWETDLQIKIANTETSHPGYDEYRYNVGDISHNPYELMAYLTAKYQNFNSSTAQAELAALFGEQFTLAFAPSVEIRYADPSDADDDGDYEPYNWNVLTVTLTAKSFTDVVSGRMNSDELGRYTILMQTKGSRQYIANPFGDMNWLSYVTSYYGYRIHPVSGEKNYHKGVDIGLPTGTPIQSGQDGTVTFAGYSGDYGNVVVIEDDKGLVSKYAHCNTLNVTVGQSVKTGDAIATVGSTGNSTGAHLHLEVLKNGQYLNPLYYCVSGDFNLTPTYGDPGSPMGDGSYAALIAEAEKYLSYPYVWGGSSPSTSFDCSGYVSWVLTHSGVKNVGRLGANDLYNTNTPVSPNDARPGDLIAFHSTYSAPKPVTHIGIYVGTDATGRPRMIHCGNPIQYTYIDTPYWQAHFYGFARVN
ncbi:MAG: peptidoglycan DD-metalloendopeptidase family protein [Oscillospiraceae bacterium]|jgi:murein DD-endopeptidase MepM/ murein hydrolase activator NlpD|nr:peptidoglycan DD-metalloendopeptidase family protein [Oscillospiraceae bacterium]